MFESVLRLDFGFRVPFYLKCPSQGELARSDGGLVHPSSVAGDDLLASDYSKRQS